MKDVVIVNPKDLDRKIKVISEQGPANLHIVSDFDRTLTKAFVDGKKFTSVIHELYDGNHLSKDYTEKAQALWEKYHPIEVSPIIPFEEKKKAMEEWWRLHYKLLIDSGLNLKDIQELVDNGKLKFREGALEFFDLIKDRKVPLVIFSSNGIGETILLYLKKIKRNYENIHLITNLMEYDKKGYATAIKEPVIHVFNKGEVALKGLPIMKELRNRKNIILLGDTLKDLDMIQGFEYNEIIKIGFYNYEEESLEEFKKKYDVIILNDGSLNYLNKLLKIILG
jgi:cytosolic 5'-nucleotidase 3